MFTRTMKATVVAVACMGVMLGARAQSDDEHPDVLAPGRVLFTGDAVSSMSGDFVLIYQGDGNLVLYDTRNPDVWVPLWATSTVTDNPGFAVMQEDGNLVVYNGNGQPTWATGTDGMSGTFVVVQDDGNLVLYADYGARWPWASCTVVR